MSNHRDSKKGDDCTTTTVTLCNGALTVVKELQSKYFSEHSRYLSTPRAINMLLQQIKSEAKTSL